MFIEAKDDGGGGDNWTTAAISRAKLQSNHRSSPPTNHHPVFLQAVCPSCRPTNSAKSTEGKNITFHGLAYSKLTWGLTTLSLTTNCSWLPWGRVAIWGVGCQLLFPYLGTFPLLSRSETSTLHTFSVNPHLGSGY